MQTVRNLTETERKVVANDSDTVVDMSGIDKEKQIPKNCDLKTEIEIKKHNQQRELLIKERKEQEAELKKHYREIAEAFLKMSAVVIELTHSSGYTLGKIQVGAIDNVISMFSSIQVKKFILPVMKQMNVLMSYTHGRHVSQAIHSQPLCLLSVIKYIFCLNTPEEEDEIYKCYDKLQSHIPSFGFNQSIKTPEHASYE